jgi:predicted lipoprotein with Yx(FWY)xxD motif
MLNQHLPRVARLVAVVGLIGSSLLASTAFASPSVTSNGSILTDDRGMTLYKYTPDQPGVSTCYGGCAVAWPPVIADGTPASADPQVGVASRNDGTLQLTYAGSPLYYYVGDTQPGQTTGDGSDGVWFVVQSN